MSNSATHLLLPYLMASQAQKHVTHNEALRLLDAMVQLAVLDRTRTAPPGSPADGDRYIVASGATGLRAGWDLNIAYWVDGAWTRLAPRPGWLTWIAAEAAFVGWTGAAWQALGAPVDVSPPSASCMTPIRRRRRCSTSPGSARARPGPTACRTPRASSRSSPARRPSPGRRPSQVRSPPRARPRPSAGATASGSAKTVNLGTGGASGSTTVVNIGSATAGAGGTTVVNTPTVTFANAVTEVGMPQANLTAQLLGLGGAAADSFNRLSLNAPAVLLNNAGAGIEATVNKAAPANDAAFAFKTGFSARALFGLLGDDDFRVKVSPDGSTFHDAIQVERSAPNPSSVGRDERRLSKWSGSHPHPSQGRLSG